MRPWAIAGCTSAALGLLFFAAYFIQSCSPVLPHNIHIGDRSEAYVPRELKSVLVCIGGLWDVGRLPYLELLLYSIHQYHSPWLDVLLVTDQPENMRSYTGRLNIDLNITVYYAKRPANDHHPFWVAFEHRIAIEAAVKRHQYTTVMYLEDDCRVSWPALVSWAVDTRLLEPQNFTRCFFRTEVRPSDGGVFVTDWFPQNTKGAPFAMDVRPDVDRIRLDMAQKDAALFNKTRREVDGTNCGAGPNGTVVRCVVHQHFAALFYPYQGLWVATTTQLARFMKSKLWNKSDALAFKMEPFVNGSWGYPERASSTAVFGGLVPVPQGRTSAPSSCMLPYIPASQGAPGQVSFQAHSDHLPNKYVQMGSGVKFENVTRGG